MSLYGFCVHTNGGSDFGAVLADSSVEALHTIRSEVGDEPEISMYEFTEMLAEQYNGLAFLSTGA